MKRDKGITLIVLIITIIVMLILAAVTINTVTGGKLIDKAEEAITNYQLHIFEDELRIYHSKKELKLIGDDYNPKGLYAYYDKIVYLSDEYTAVIDSDRNIYDILDSLEGSRFDGKVWIKEGEIVFEPGEYELNDLIGELTLAATPNPAEQKVDAIILYDVKLGQNQELQYRLNSESFQTGATYDESAEAPTVTIPITKEYVNSMPDKKVIIYARIYNTVKNEELRNGQLTITVPTAPTDIEFTPTENTLTVLATGSTDISGLGIKGYMYSIDGGTTWSDIIDEGTTYTFDGISANTEKTVIAKAVNKIGFESDTYSKTVKTNPLAGVTITPSIPNNIWTSGDVELTITYNGENNELPDGYAIEYTTDNEENWSLYTEKVLVTENQTTVKARVTNNTINDKGEETNYTVENIDKVPPTIPTSVQVSRDVNSLTIQRASGSTDTLSGLEGYCYSINAGEEGECWTDALSENETYTFDDLPSGVIQKITVKSVDKVEWESERYETNVSTIGQYTIHYETNLEDDVSNMPENQIKTENVDIALSSLVPTTIGRTFQGWSTDANAVTPEYAPGATFTTDSDTTLYAIWSTTMTYTITLDNQGAITPGTTALSEKYKTEIFYMDKSTKKVMTTTSNPIVLPTKTGYTFEGYYTEQNGVGLQMLTATGYLTDDFYNTRFTANSTLYAKWHENELSIYYYPNGGTNNRNNGGSWQWQTSGTYSGSGRQIVTYSQAANKNIWDVRSVFSKEGYHVTSGADDAIAWIKDSPTSGQYVTQAYNNFQSLIANGDAVLKLYANWQVNTATIYHYPNGATTNKYPSNGTDSKSTKTTNYYYQTTDWNVWDVSSLFERTGYTTMSNQQAWIVDTPDSGVYLDQTTTIDEFKQDIQERLKTETGIEINTYANWKPNVYTITLDNQSATTAGSTAVYEKYNTGIYKESGCTTRMTTSANPITIPKKTGYKFEGYYTATNGGGTQLINASGNITTNFTTTKYTGAATLYAKWTETQLSIYYYPNGGELKKTNNDANWEWQTSGTYANSGKQVVKYSDASNKNLWNVTSVFSRYGYSVADNNADATAWREGSATSKNYVSQAYNDFTSRIANSDAVLKIYANWQPNVHNLTIDPNGGTIVLPKNSSGTYENTTSPYTMSFTYDTKKLFMETSGYVDSGSMSTSPWLGTSENGYINGEFLPYKKNYVFTGWSITSGGGTITDHSWNSNYENHVGIVHDYLFDSNYDGDVTIKANWGTVSYTVSYNPNTGSESGDKAVGNMPTTQTKVSGSNLTLSNKTPTRSGYSFASWNTKANGSGTSYSPSGTYSANADVTLYAQWTNEVYDITLNNQSATTAGSTHVYEKYNVGVYKENACTNKMTTSANAITKPQRKYTVTYNYNGADGGNSDATKTATYTFGGYYTSTGGNGTQLIGTNGNITSSFTNTYFSSNKTIYAKWTSASITLPTPTKTGYTFAGWYSNSNLTTKIGNAGASYTPTANITLYAKWTAKTIKVTFKRNHSSGDTTTATQTFTYDGGTQSFSDKGWSTKRTGYTQGRWYTNQACTSSASYPITSGVNNNWINTNSPSIILYASWSPITYQVKYNANGGTGSMSNSSHTYNTAKALTANAFTAPTGYNSFKEWNTSADGSGTSYANQESVKNLSSTADAVVNLYAQWNPITYSVKYNANGGSGSMSNSSHTYNVAKNLTANAFTPPAGYKSFKNWNTQANGSGTTYSNKQSVKNLTTTSGGTFNLYAQWNENTFKITLNNQNATTAGSTAVYEKYNVGVYKESGCTNKMTTSANAITKPSKTGYTFDGYYTGTGGSGTQMIDKNGYIKSAFTNKYYTANGTLYAKWVANTYYVKYNANGGSGSMSNTTHTYGTASALRANAFTKTNYVFEKWNTKANGSGTSYANKANVSNLTTTNGGTVTLYAQWKPAPANIVEKKVIPAIAFPGASWTDGLTYTKDGYRESTMFSLVPKNLSIEAWAASYDSYQFYYTVKDISNKQIILSGYKNVNSLESRNYAGQSKDYIIGSFVRLRENGALFETGGVSNVEAHIDSNDDNYEFVRSDINKIISSITSDVYDTNGNRVASGYKAYLLGEDLKVTYTSSSGFNYYKYYYDSSGNINLYNGYMSSANGNFVTTPTVKGDDRQYYQTPSHNYLLEIPEIYFFPSNVKLTSVVNNLDTSRVYQISEGAYFYEEVITSIPGMTTKYNIGTINGNTVSFNTNNEVTVATSTEKKAKTVTIYVPVGRKLKVTVTDTSGKETITEKTLN